MSDPYVIRLLMSEFLTHDVKRFVVSRPAGFKFHPGQGVELSINTPQEKAERRPFTPTSLADDQVLEFTIKGYPDHKGVTQALHGLPPGSELLMTEPFGTIQYQGPGVFIAGGAGITPFLAILRECARRDALADQTLMFSNKTHDDIICEKELRHYFKQRCILTCTQESTQGYEQRRIDKAFLTEKLNNFDQNFYVCGPPGFMKSVNAALKDLGADPQSLVFER